MYIKINHIILNQWQLQKKFNSICSNKYILYNKIYKKIYLLEHIHIYITMLNTLTNINIKLNTIEGYIIQYIKNKFSIVFREKYNKFILTINLKSPAFIYEYYSTL